MNDIDCGNWYTSIGRDPRQTPKKLVSEPYDLEWMRLFISDWAVVG